MDPLGFGRIVTDNWGILMMHPDAFSAVFGLGLILGWALARVLLNERISRQELRITDLQAVVDGKLPVGFLPPSKRNRPMSFSLKSFWAMGAEKTTETKYAAVIRSDSSQAGKLTAAGRRRPHQMESGIFVRCRRPR